jgi:hypothetical protein
MTGRPTPAGRHVEVAHQEPREPRAGELMRRHTVVVRELCRSVAERMPAIPRNDDRSPRRSPDFSAASAELSPVHTPRARRARRSEECVKSGDENCGGVRRELRWSLEARGFRQARGARRNQQLLVVNRTPGAGPRLRWLGHQGAIGKLAHPDDRGSCLAVDRWAGHARPPALPDLRLLRELVRGIGAERPVVNHRLVSQPRAPSVASRVPICPVADRLRPIGWKCSKQAETTRISRAETRPASGPRRPPTLRDLQICATWTVP